MKITAKFIFIYCLTAFLIVAAGIGLGYFFGLTQYFLLSGMLAVALLLVIMPVAGFFRKQFVLPIIILSKIAKNIAAGEFNQSVYMKRNDEIGELAKSFNSMTEYLRTTTTSLDNLHQEIAERKKVETELQKNYARLQTVTQELEKARIFAEEANRSKSVFLSNMSHELRTPLNAIIGFSQILKDEGAGVFDDIQKEYLTDIEQSGKRLLALINDILDVTKVDAGKMELRPASINLKEIIMSSLAMIKEKALKRRITLVEDLETDVGMVFADERKVKQIMFNLLSNAVKFTPEGGKIGIGIKNNENNEAVISVWDTGIGIEPEDAEKVFAEFEQVDADYSRKYSGTGLGMPLTKKLVELHGGKIWFESEGKDKGVCFSFTLPKHMLTQILDKKIELIKKRGQELSVFLFKVDNYERLTEVHGVDKIKNIVFLIAEMFRGVLRPGDVVIEKEEDEILIFSLLNNQNARSLNKRLEQGVIKVISREHDLSDTGVSRGIATYSEDLNTAEVLLREVRKNLASLLPISEKNHK
ncbi:MAG: ATP-binding protein [Candidatus Omnitrophota bacterium]